MNLRKNTEPTSTSTLRELYQHPYLGHGELLQRTTRMIAGIACLS